MKGSLVVDYHLKNKIFDLNDKNTNRDNCSYCNWLLKEKFSTCGVELATCDIFPAIKADVAIYFDVPLDDVVIGGHSYLVLYECEVIKEKSWDKEIHLKYSKIFTWHDDLVDNKKYFKINFAHKFPDNKDAYRSNQILFRDKKLCSLIAGNKIVSHKLELYSERVKTIRWFEYNALDDFDLHGIGWDRYVSKNKIVRRLVSILPIIGKLFLSPFCSYKGPVESKFETFSKYKFAICYENAQMIPGYITEKIFDCFFAGCVPIYWGAPNVTDHIPRNCFIDRRDFNSHEELYSFIKNMTEKEYNEIQQNIEDYLFSKKADPYRAETFANTIIEQVKKDLEQHPSALE